MDAGRRGVVAEAQEVVGLEEELSDAPIGAGIDLALQVLEVGLGVGRIWMLLGIARDADLERPDLLQASDQGGRILITTGMDTAPASYQAPCSA